MRYSNFKNAFKSYIKNNYKEYVLVSLLFIIGIFVGVMIINNIKYQQTAEITSFISEFITKYKELENINKTALIIESIRKNLIFAIVLWLAGTTVIGMPIVLIIILLRGTILGFTISSISVTLGPLKGSLFCLISIVLHNIIYIPAILSIGVSSIKLYKSIIKDKRKENIKIEIIRHTIIFGLMMILLVLSAIIENVISISILKKFIKYF
ncbi:MAG: stage II sporulation protein M [Clostridia bacterium]|nr:stage II sporulation protein M [Clostridia bacterium]